MTGSTWKRYRVRWDASTLWLSVWMWLLLGLSIWFAWNHLLLDAIWPAALAWAFAVRRD
jgi:hypothetical protein